MVRLLIIFAMCVATLGPAVLRAQEAASIQLRILAIDQRDYPQVLVRVLASDALGQALGTPPTYQLLLDGAPIDAVATRLRVPVAVSLVFDRGSRMSDAGTTPFISRFDDARALARELIDTLQREPDQLAALVTFTDQVEAARTVPLSHDLGLISNVINQADPALPFAAEPLDGASGAAYPLGDAILAGLDQLEQAPDDAQRALVVFAAGDDRAPVDVAAIQARLAESDARQHPVQLVIVSLGSADPASFQRIPAAPATLVNLAEALDASVITVGDQPPDQAQRRAISDQFAALLARGRIDQITINLGERPVGSGQLAVLAGAARDAVEVEFGAIAPRFRVTSDSPALRGQVRLGVEVAYSAAPLAEVNYLLDNRLLTTTPVRADADFALMLDTADPAFQQRFPPGRYVLAATATDSAGRAGNALNTLEVTVVAPTVIERAGRLWWVFALVFGVVLLAALLVLGVLGRRRGNVPVIAGAGAAAVQSGDTQVYQRDAGGAADVTVRHDGKAPAFGDVTVRYDDDGVTERHQPGMAQRREPDVTERHQPGMAQRREPDVTERHQPGMAQRRERSTPTYADLTERHAPGATPAAGRAPATDRLVSWNVSIAIPGLAVRHVALAGRSTVSIGRRDASYPSDIDIDHQTVSRRHIVLEQRADGTLHALVQQTGNGTYAGIDQRRLEPGAAMRLSSGDILWLGPHVRIEVRHD
ncbi:MAG: FHA domain-containing protein [Chloroflexi bacterium]|nr:FHA domain-containing protein [Chloroflexota bacterium]